MRAVQAVIAQRLALPQELHKVLVRPEAQVKLRCVVCTARVMSPALAKKQQHDSATAGLQPLMLWKFFAELSQIPRPSKHEERQASKHICFTSVLKYFPT